MKRKLRLVITAVLAAISLVSCNKQGSDVILVKGTVTFRPFSGGKFYLKQDDSTALILKNVKDYPFSDGLEKRALVAYEFDPNNPGTSQVEGYKRTFDVTLCAMDTIFTKAPVQYNPADEDKYGNDPVGLYLDQMLFPSTMIEDGYLCVRFEMPLTGGQHIINLLTGVDPRDPYVVEFRHNRNGDGQLYTDTFYANFPLKSLPDTKGKVVPLTLRWNSLASGKIESVTFDYCSRTDW